MRNEKKMKAISTLVVVIIVIAVIAAATGLFLIYDRVSA
ncbi:hypothetical protein IC006_0753 [Sulfuracidifex tepidarius]|uniref:Uncharacterized protein n=1 Tax=Sulfuracidifex tepidarius TaxID=1294262 RepID=A0A510DTH2_9CREN|nr:hypothetical protein IC006_0753 [Sulfuracidifex tepidarius]BBG26222.1 hypothetical protein IC007_0727 [Sulfuracidifex tepidarius]